MIQVCTNAWDGYELLDSGHLKKLERFGEHVIVREETKAWWKPELPERDWNTAVASHSGDEKQGWTFHAAVPQEWTLRFETLTLEARFTATSKHVGIFPEQEAHWRWIAQRLDAAQGPPVRVLNLFGYTGIATLVAAAHGATVTHVDSAKGVVAWGKQNQQRSGLGKRPVRWIVDDVVKFVTREIRREKRYDAILLDPPSFGRGPKRELWKVEQQLVELLSACRQLLSETPRFVLMTLYSLDHSSLLVANLLSDMMRGVEGNIEVGELALRPARSSKILPMSIFGRWQSA